MLLRVYQLLYSGPEQLTVVPVDCRAAGLTGLQAPVYDVTGSSMTVTWYVVVVIIMCSEVISTSKDFTVDNNGISITSIIIMIIVLSCDNDDCRPG